MGLFDELELPDLPDLDELDTDTLDSLKPDNYNRRLITNFVLSSTLPISKVFALSTKIVFTSDFKPNKQRSSMRTYSCQASEEWRSSSYYPLRDNPLMYEFYEYQEKLYTNSNQNNIERFDYNTQNNGSLYIIDTYLEKHIPYGSICVDETPNSLTLTVYSSIQSELAVEFTKLLRLIADTYKATLDTMKQTPKIETKELAMQLGNTYNWLLNTYKEQYGRGEN